MRKSSDAGIATLAVGLLLALFVLIAVVACEGDDGGSTYPHTTTYGYYDSQHHYHYYPQYKKGGKGYKVPAPKSGPRFAAPKGSGGGTKFGKRK